MDKGPVRDTLVLHPQVLADMLAHCRREAPHEACGWISGMRDAPWLRVGQADAGQAPLERLGAAGAGREQAADGEADAGEAPVLLYGQRAHPMRNVHPDPVRRYEMDPAEQFAVMRRMRQAGEELVAIYHSHPATEPVPSQTDIDLAYTKDAVYLIVSLKDDEPVWRAWWLDCDTRRCDEVAVLVAAEEGAEGAGGVAAGEGG